GHAARAGEGHAVGGALVAVVAQPFAAVRLDDDLPDAVAEARGRTLSHAGRGLEHVPVGVDDAGCVLCHGGLLEGHCRAPRGSSVVKSFASAAFRNWRWRCTAAGLRGSCCVTASNRAALAK